MLLRNVLKGTKIVSCGRRLKLCFPLRGNNSCMIISCSMFAAQYPKLLLFILRLNTLRGIRYQNPYPSHMGVAPLPPTPRPYFDQHFPLTSPSSPTTTRIGSVRISRQSISTFFLNVALNSNATDKIGKRPFMPALRLNLGR